MLSLGVRIHPLEFTQILKKASHMIAEVLNLVSFGNESHWVDDVGHTSGPVLIAFARPSPNPVQRADAHVDI